MFRFITRQILTGLITILPVMLTLYLIYWFVVSTEKALGGVIKFILPDVLYWPGMGFVAALLLVFVIGMLMQLYVVKALFNKIEDLLYHMPLIKSVYGAIRDFFQYFSPSRQTEFQQVVAVDMGNDMELIGFVTLDSSASLPLAEDEQQEKVLVYLPMSYNIGGYPIMMPTSRLRPIDMSMEQAMRFVLTAGVASNGDKD
ncbi:DUF502 domain-containing protein [uncultured Methylophaga sp.]|jgi:uncharacterized membrane protein|uniref:DUF502 domain-containing protein n=1 Tax=uncultured Methylophaga sp. TaxID=285271 RepID=UPI00260BE19E|nr:DUF502 domain-containing protein [uncultured Methylophaga sp.]